MARLTRREVAALLAAFPALAQTVTAPPVQQPAPAPRTVAAADDGVRKASEKLRALNVPMDIQPAFLFKA